MGKTVRRDKVFWWPYRDDGTLGILPVVKGIEGLKNRREKDCKPGCRLCERGKICKRERMKKSRREARLDIDECM